MTTQTFETTQKQSAQEHQGHFFNPDLIAVLGAGVMGAQIAAHFANVGKTVLLFDRDLPSTKPRSTSTAALKTLKKLKPSPLFTKDTLSRLIPCSYDFDLEKLKNADFIIEAIAEKQEIKESLYKKITPFIQSSAILASNTSGLSIEKLAHCLPSSLKERFLGVHFFNPPRYMTLVETITHSETNEDILEPLEHFLTFSLGKNIIRAPDSPNFIANRLGVFSLLSVMKNAEEFNLKPDLVDKLTGPLLYRPKSATYFTMDVVGLDITKNVIQTMFDHLKNDPWHQSFQLPEWIEGLISQGALGMKTKKGIYSKVKGKKVVFNQQEKNWETLCAEVDPQIIAAGKIQDPQERFQNIFKQDHQQAKFIQKCLIDIAAYACYHCQELAQTPADIDLALRWGFGWQYGIFEIMQMLDFENMYELVKKQYSSLSFSLEMKAAFSENTTFDLKTKTFRSYRDKKIYGDLAKFPTFLEKPKRALIKDFTHAKLEALSDNIWNLSLCTKNLVISDRALSALIEAIHYAESRCQALVFGPNGENFALGADLKMVHQALVQENWQQLNKAVKLFQETSKLLTQAQIPIVAAVQGMALGGGCEFVMQSQSRVLTRESYIGLVEVGVGLIPAAGGCVTFIEKSLKAADREEYLFEVFKNLMTAHVCKSAQEALDKEYGSLSDIIVAHPDMLLSTAQNHAQFLAQTQSYFTTPSFVSAPKEHAWALMESWRVNAYEGGFLFEHENHIAQELAKLLSGYSWKTGATREHLFDLEFDIFMNLLKTEMTKKKIEHMLTTGKPLRG